MLPIRWRLALWYAGFLLVTDGAVGVFILTTVERNLERQVDDALRLRASRVELQITTGDDEDLDPEDVATGLLELAPMEEFSAPGIYVQVRDDAGTTLASSGNLPAGQLPAAPEIITAALAGRETFANAPAEDERVRVLAQPVEKGERIVGIVLVGQSLRFVDATVRGLRQIIVAAAATVAVAALVGGWWLTTRALGPIAELTRVARQIAATGHFERRIAAPPARDELGDLTATINDMLARLERTFRRQREFLADASHELRGPLMVIRGNLDLLKLDLPDAERRESLREATEVVERMSRLASDLLFLAETDAPDTVERRPVVLHELAAEVWERARAVDAGSHELAFAQTEPVTVLGDRDRLAQMLWNLVENALRYTPDGGRVSLALRSNGRVADVTVADTGIGIPTEHLPRIFERFYRVDRARSREHGGAGLGLAIVRQTAELHGGQVHVRSDPGGGTTFTVSLPVERA